MRAFDRDLIRGGHYGQRPGVPRSKAEHMAAPTNAADAKKTLANQEPSTHGPTRTCSHVRSMSASLIHNADAGLLDRYVQSSKMVHAALLLLMLEAVTRTSFHHQPEAQHPKSSV